MALFVARWIIDAKLLSEEDDFLIKCLKKNQNAPIAELGGGRKVEVRARSNLVTLSALCRPHRCVGVRNDSEA